ncbi:MAG TPA: sugar phosphate isomerase/epimerase family protein [Acidimicrobiia bacterium]|nr:sugar phosphate isomerase/epimerase family protein [Acidimicrobiia bacterium]
MTASVPDIGLGCANLLEATLPELIDIAARAGFRRITVRPYAFAQALEAGWTEAALRGRLAGAGISVTMVDALTHALPGMPRVADLDARVQARLPRDLTDPPDETMCFRAATALGASIVNVTHYMGQSLPLQVLSDAVGAVCRRAEAQGIRISLEFLPESGFPDLPSAQAVVDACGAANVGVLLDVFHLDRSGGTVEDVLRLPPRAIAGIQLSDRRRPAAGTRHVPLSGRLLPGEGELPLRELVEAALQNSPAATVDIEVLNDELRALPPGEAAARLAAAAGAWRASIA